MHSIWPSSSQRYAVMLLMYSVAFEITKLIKLSPKKNAIFDRIRSEDEDGSSVGIRTFCPTRWTMRVDSIESILSNYDNLNKLWEYVWRSLFSQILHKE